MSDAPFDVQRAHRWFAVELNNLAWTHVEASRRSDEDVERMIHAAHGACFHWLEVGEPLNHLRAQSLLASAYVVAGHADAAVRHARKCLLLSEQAGESQTAFDRACCHGSAALAFMQAGDTPAMEEHARAFEAAYHTLADDDERAVVDRLYRTTLINRCS